MHFIDLHIYTAIHIHFCFLKYYHIKYDCRWAYLNVAHGLKWSEKQHEADAQQQNVIKFSVHDEYVLMICVYDKILVLFLRRRAGSIL